MRKWIALSIVMLFVIAAVSANGDDSEINEVTGTKVNPSGMMNAEESKEVVKYAKEMREKWRNMREKYIEAMGEYREVRQEWVKARQEWMNTRASGDSNAIIEKGKNVLDKGIELAIKHLEVVKERVENDPTLSEEEKGEILDKLESYASWLEEKKEEASTIETKEELRQYATEIREKWMDARGEVKGIVGKIASARIEYALNRAEKAGDRVEEIINKYKDEGYDTSEAEELLQKFRDKLEDAKQKYEEVKQKWDEVETVEDARQLVNEIHQYIKEISQEIKEGYKNLKESIKELKSLKAEQEG